MSDDNKGTEPYSAAFAPMVRQKLLWHWSKHQVVVAAVCLAIIMFNISLARVDLFAPVNLVCLAVLGVDLPIVKRMSLWQIAALQAGFLLRRATGASRSTISPITAGDTVALLDVPGPEGKIIRPYELVNSGEMNGSCWIWDAESCEATSIIRFRSAGSELAKNTVKNSHADSFSMALHSLVDHPEVERVTFQTRSLTRPTGVTAPADGGSEAERDVWALETGALRTAMYHDYTVTVTISPAKRLGRRPTVRDTGDVLYDVTSRFIDMLSPIVGQAGPFRWLDAQQVRGDMKCLTDPDAYTLLDKDGRLDDDQPVWTSYEEFADYIRVGSTYARTYWIDRWPEAESPVIADWLVQLDSSPDTRMVFTQAFHARNQKEAKTALEMASNETGVMDRFNQMLNRQPDTQTLDEARLMERRKQENTKEHGDVEFQGFVTVLANSQEDLDQACQNLHARTGGYAMHLDKQINQQLTRWVGALPLGMEGRR